MFTVINNLIFLISLIVLVCDFFRKRTYNQLALTLGLIVCITVSWFNIQTSVLLACVCMIAIQVSYKTSLRRVSKCKK